MIFSKRMSVSRRGILAFPPERVWSVIGDFTSMALWNSNITECALFQADGITLRRMKNRDGKILEERLLARSDVTRTIVYSMDTPPNRIISHYTATQIVEPFEGDGSKTSLTWIAACDTRFPMIVGRDFCRLMDHAIGSLTLYLQSGKKS